jgi:hypothetical protein
MNAIRCKLAALCCVMVATLPASAQDKGAQDRGDRTIEQYSCKDVMRESGGNRDVAIAFLHGFIIGKSGDNKFNVETLRKQTDAFIERCLENPGRKAFDAMNEVKK